MKYITMQQKLRAFIVMFILTGCAIDANAVKVRGPVDHADSAEWLKEHFDCDIDYAQIIRKYLMNLDDALFNFLDYEGNKEKYNNHIRTLERHICHFKAMIDKERKNPKHKKAVKKLEKICKDLEKVYEHIRSAAGTSGFGAAQTLGKKLKPLLVKFDDSLPIDMNVKMRIKRKYGYDLNKDIPPFSIMNHLRQRLSIA